MLLDLAELVEKYAMEVRGVLHLGAHLAEEAPVYGRLFAGTPVWWVEANPAVIPKILNALRPYPAQRLIHALVAEVDGDERVLHVTNYDGMSSSMLPFGTHPTFSPDTVFVDDVTLPTKTVDTLVDEYAISDVNLLVMDLQGCELLALQGASKLLEGVDYVMTEINLDEVYIGCAKVHELDALLTGFTRTATYWVGVQGWGDGFYVRNADG